jgi:hypothetical protein
MACFATHFSRRREERDEDSRRTSLGISRLGQFLLRILMIDKEAVSSLEERLDTRKHKPDALSNVIGICEGPQDLAEKHDSYAY